MNWESRHLYYGGEANSLLRDCVVPLVGALRPWSDTYGFFFVRYRDQAGPHLRLRFGMPAAIDPASARKLVDNAIADAIRHYLERRALVHGEPEALHSEAAAFEPEVERYGGPLLLPASLDFFSISSAFALAYVQRYGDRARGRQLVLVLCVLLWQTWGFARNAAQLATLIQWEAGSGVAASARTRADEIFDDDPSRWASLIEEQIGILTASDEEASFAEVEMESAATLAAAARLLAVALCTCGARTDILRSHLHMTANRLGLSNWEECFVSRVLYRGLSYLESETRLSHLDLDADLDRAWSASLGRTETLRTLIPRHFMALEGRLANNE